MAVPPVDSNGVVWTGLAASSELASFDARKCKDLNGPAKVDGSQCREGWTLYRTTGPPFNAVPFNPANVASTAAGKSGSSESSGASR